MPAVFNHDTFLFRVGRSAGLISHFTYRRQIDGASNSLEHACKFAMCMSDGLNYVNVYDWLGRVIRVYNKNNELIISKDLLEFKYV